MTQSSARALLVTALVLNGAGVVVGLKAFAALLPIPPSTSDGGLPATIPLIAVSLALLILGLATGAAWFGVVLRRWSRPASMKGFAITRAGVAGSLLLIVAMGCSVPLNGAAVANEVGAWLRGD